MFKIKTSPGGFQMTKYSFIKNLEQDGWELRIGGYMKNDYVISDEKHNGVGIFIEDTDDDSFHITCKKWESIDIEFYYNKKINFNDLPDNYVEFINNIASTIYKKGLIRYNLNMIQKDFK